MHLATFTCEIGSKQFLWIMHGLLCAYYVAACLLKLLGLYSCKSQRPSKIMCLTGQWKIYKPISML